jgi:asparagine synthase (glutamine-hydrolysing)
MPLQPVAERVRRRRLTYLSPAKLESLYSAITLIKATNIAGDFLDFGIALGGSGICIASELDGQRRFFGFDIFGMIPPPSAEDGEAAGERYRVILAGQSAGIGGDTYYGYVETLLQVVRENFAEFGVPEDGDRVRLLPGLFEETLPHVPEITVALAHIDCDWYRSVRCCLDYVYPRLSRCGFIILDDYNFWEGCKNATDEFCTAHPDMELVRSQPHAVLRRTASVP